MSIFSKKHNEKIDNPSITIHLNKIESRITFKIKTGDYVQEVLTPETMKLLWSTENKITKDKNDKYVPYFDITKVVLVYGNIVIIFNKIQESCIHLFQINHLIVY